MTDNNYTRGITTCYDHGNRMPCSKCQERYERMRESGELDRIAEKVKAQMEANDDY